MGSFSILGTAVRKRAYETIKNANPNWLAMLELSRLAACFGSDLGSSSPWISREGERIVASFILRYSEAEGLQTFAKALAERQRDPTFQMNIVDLEPLTKSEVSAELDSKFSVPDFRPYEKSFRIDKFSDLNQFARIVLEGQIS
jgi:hypothetical protein